jgi:hypothetical protein
MGLAEDLLQVKPLWSGEDLQVVVLVWWNVQTGNLDQYPGEKELIPCSTQ